MGTSTDEQNKEKQMKLAKTHKEAITEAIDRVNELVAQHEALVEELEQGADDLKVAIEEAGMEFSGKSGLAILKSIEDIIPTTTKLPADLLDKVKKCMAGE